MASNEDLRKILERKILKAGGVSAWARANGLMSQRGNIDRMYNGTRGISEAIAERLGYRYRKDVWEKR